MRNIQSMGIVLVVSLLGVWIFNLLHLPVPWLLGPLFFVLISQFFIQTHLYWPSSFRNIGLIVIGISVGQSFQFHFFENMGRLIGIMLSMNVMIALFSLLLAYGLVKAGHISLKTAMTCTVPGGLSQIVAFAEEEKEIDLAVVTYFHVVRVITIVLGIPLLLHAHAAGGGKGADFSLSSFAELVLLLVVAAGSVWVGKKLKIPVPYFLSPMLLVIGMQILSFETPEVPGGLLHIAQLMMGAYIGQLLTPKMLVLGKRIVLLGVATTILLMLFTIGQGWILMKMMGYSLATSILGTAAGGLDQMSLLASAIGADVTIVTIFQMFRILFVFIIVLPLLKAFCRHIDERDTGRI